MAVRQKIALVLEDGTAYYGRLVGHLSEEGSIGEVVFNTSLSGYQEIISDPSYKGQFVCFTYPSIGNYGTNPEDDEFARVELEGIIMRDYCEVPSNFRSTKTLEEYLNHHNKPGITGIDTRALVRHIREQGSMQGGLFIHKDDADWLEQCVSKVKAAPSIEGANLTTGFKGEEANAYVQQQITKRGLDAGQMIPVAVLDFGIKYSILDNFLDNGIYPTVFAGDSDMQSWANFDKDQFKGFFFSNGPGDPAVVEQGINNIKAILDYKKPVFGICLGHQMLSKALGAETFKMKFGHHGGNQPVKDERSSQVIITSQNHGFAVDPDSIKSALTKFKDYQLDKNPNDQTIEGYIIHDDPPVLSVQYHPEAGPGPHDARQAFESFKAMLS